MAADAQTVPLGTTAPDFDLPTVDGSRVARTDAKGSVLCVAFVCNHCPYVQHVEDELGRLTAEDEFSEVVFVGICSNDARTHPEDGPDGLRDQADRAGWSFPYAIDADSSVGRAYQAVCTPDFFVYDAQHELVYRGAMDTTTPRSGGASDGGLLRDALRAALDGRAVLEPHEPPMGCSIKWADAS